MKTNSLLLFFTGLVVACLISECTSDTANPSICFQEDILPIFVSNCTVSGCHSGGKGRGEGENLNLSTYEGIMTGINAGHPGQSNIYNSISGNRPSMPPSGYPSLTSKQIKYIKIWISSGAPNSSNCVSCDSTQFTYGNRIQPLLTKWCGGCHSANNASGGYDFSSYSSTILADTSRFLGALRQESGFKAMPQNSGRLSDCDINALANWISAGRQNN